MLTVSDLSLTYPGQNLPVIDGVDLSVREGEFVSLVGPSGCGKSTVLRIIMGLQTPSHGNVDYQVRDEDVGFLFQDDALLPWRTVYDNITLGLKIRGVGKSQAIAKADQWLSAVGLEGLGKRYPNELSGGQRKRVAIAQVMILEPKLLLMDEPFSSLDAIVRHYLTQDLLALVQDHGLTVVMVTHDLDEAIAVSDRVVLLTNGPRAHIKKQVEVPLPRPRDLIGVHNEPEFAPLVDELWQALSQEVVRQSTSVSHESA